MILLISSEPAAIYADASIIMSGLPLRSVSYVLLGSPPALSCQHGQELGAVGGSLVCTIFGPMLMAILLVSRLEARCVNQQYRGQRNKVASLCVSIDMCTYMRLSETCLLSRSSFSTFIIFIPVFLVLYCCVFAVGCGFCCLSNMSTEMFDEEDTASDDPGASMMKKEKVEEQRKHSAEVPAASGYKPPVSSDEPGDIESNQYGTFSAPEKAQNVEETVSSAEVDVDID